MNRDRLSAYGALILAPLLWAGNFYIGKLVHNAIPPFTFAFLRWLLVTLLLLPIILIRKEPVIKLIKTNFLSLLWVSLLGISAYTPLIYLGLHYTTIINVSLINALVPTLITFFSCYLLAVRLTLLKTLGLLLSLIGVLLVICAGHLQQVLALNFNKGDMLIFIAVCGFSLYSVCLKKLDFKINPTTFLFIISLLGTLLLLPTFLFEYYQGQHISINLLTLSSLFYTALFASIVALLGWNYGVLKIGAQQAGLFFNLLPVFSSILAVAFMGEQYHFYHLISFILVISGIFLSHYSGIS